MYLPPHQHEVHLGRRGRETEMQFNLKMLGTKKDMCVTPPTCCNDGVNKQCDSFHCREVDVQLGVVSLHGSTQAV